MRYTIIFCHLIFTLTGILSFAQKTQALKSIDSLKNLCGKENSKILLADRYIRISKSYASIADTLQAYQYLQKALVTSMSSENDSCISAVIKKGAKFYSKYFSKDSLITYLNRFIEYSEKRNNKLIAADLLITKGTTYRGIFGKSNEAMNAYLKALKYYEDSKEKSKFPTAYISIANLYSDQLRTIEADSYFKKAIKSVLDLKDSSLLCNVYNDYAIMFQKQKNFERSIELYRLAYAIALKYKDEYTMSYINYNLAGNAIELLKNKSTLSKDERSLLIKETLERLKEAEKSFLKTQNAYGLAAVYICLSAVHSREKQFSQAESELKLAEAYTKQIDDAKMTVEYTLAKYEFYYAKGDYKNAVEYYSLYHKQQDSLVNAEIAQKNASMLLQYENDKKDNEIARLNLERQKDAKINEEEKKRKTFQLSAFGVFLLMTIVFSFILLKRLRVSNKQKRIIELQRDIVESKQKEILDSIHYARRIQRALVSSEYYINKELKRLKSGK